MQTNNIKSVICYYGGSQSKAYTSHDSIKIDGEGVTIGYSDEVKSKTALKSDIIIASATIDKLLIVDNTLLLWLNTWQVNYMNK